MKPTQITELLANIKVTFVSFFSILMFVALGVGVFLGISWSAPALQTAADKTFDESRFHNFQIQFPYGLTDDDLEKLAQIEGVSKIEAERQSFQTLRRGNEIDVVKVQSLGQEIDMPLLVEGELPDEANEMAFHAESAKKLGVNVGDTLTFEHDADPNAEDLSLTLSSEGDPAASQPDTSDGMQRLNGDTYTVTAIVNTADYVAKSAETYGFSSSPSGAVNALAWLPDAAFDAAAYRDAYPLVNIRSDSLAGYPTFSNDYDRESDAIAGRIRGLGETLAPARYSQIHDSAQAQVDDAERQLNDAKTQISEGEKKVSDGTAELEKGRTELDTAVTSGERELADAHEKLVAGEAAKTQGESELASARERLDEANEMLAEVDELKEELASIVRDMKDYEAEQDEKLESGEISQKTYDERLDRYGARLNVQLEPIAELFNLPSPDIDHDTFDPSIVALELALATVEDVPIEVQGETMTIAEARAKVAQLEREYAEGQAELDRKSAELAAGWEQYYAGVDKLESEKAAGEKKLSDGATELESAKQQIDSAKEQVAANEPKIDSAKERIAQLTEYAWSVLPRNHNAGVVEVATFSDVTHNLSISMAALFIIVGLLVSYFAVSRIVHEQVAQIGTKKALGFRTGEVTRSFLLYSGIAVLAGAIVGTIVGYLLVEGIIDGVLGNMFIFGGYPPYFGWPLFVIMTLLELALILGATYLACRSILKQHAVELLRGEKPPSGKTRFYEKWGIWERLPLFAQTIVNNCVNDRRRMLSTIVGVAGSTALIVTAITLNNDVMKSYDRHYEDVYGFNTITYVENGVEGALEEVETTLQGEGAQTTRVFMKRYLASQPDGDGNVMRIIVPLDEDTFKQLYHVNAITGAAFNTQAKGAWVSQAYGKHFGVKVGDVITIDGGDGRMHEITVLGFYEFWLTYHEMVMSADYFQSEFGEVKPSAVLAQTGNADKSAIEQALTSIEGCDSVVDDATYQYGNFEMFSSVSSAVVAIYLALAALMAVVVLLNLNVMFIEEKKRELIVLMINGFSVKDAKSYISYDSVVLTAIGIIAGIILGCVSGSLTVTSIEPSTGVFVSSPDLWAIGIGIVGSAILAFIMNKIALRRIPRFQLTDINKA